MSEPSSRALAFVNPAKQARFDADQRAGRDADFRDYLADLLGDAQRAIWPVEDSK